MQVTRIMISAQEISLLCKSELTEADCSLCSQLVKAKYKEILFSNEIAGLFGTSSEDSSLNENSAEELNTSLTYKEFLVLNYNKWSSAGGTSFQLLVAAVSCLEAFLQSEWTGPALNFTSKDLLPPNAQNHFTAKNILSSLSRDGEDAYHLTSEPMLLLAALTLLDLINDLVSARWWRVRALFTLQRILDNPAATIHDQIIEEFSHLESIEMPDNMSSQLYLERGLILHWYMTSSRALEYFKKAQEFSGLKWTLSGALGKRTKFQQNDVSQLVVLAKSAQNTTDQSDSKLMNLPLNDDTLLENIEFQQDNNQMELSRDENLSVLDQCILLAFCLNVKNENPVHGLTQEEMKPFVARVLLNPNNWSVYTMALLLRSRLEANRSRTVERGVLQIQELVNQIPLQESSAAERLKLIYCLLLPSKWELEKELGDSLMSIGVVRSALDIYLRLELWEQAISCHQMLEEHQKAEKLVRDELQLNPDSPKLLCILGDLLIDPNLWEKAWELSGHRFSRAKRSLGSFYFKKNEFQAACTHYREALAINPLFENSWFVYGCAAMNIKDWSSAAEAFSRCVSLDNENSEAWNNLASVYLQKEEKQKAFFALQQAAKHKRENWRIWTNYMLVATDIGRFEDTILAVMQLIDLGQKEPDMEVLKRIVWAATDQSIERSQVKGEYVDKMFSAITEKVSGNNEVWDLFAEYQFRKGRYSECFETKLKAYRAVLHQRPVGADQKAFENVAVVAVSTADLCERIKANGEDVGAMEQQLRSLLRTLIGRAKKNFSDSETFLKLQKLIDSL